MDKKRLKNTYFLLRHGSTSYQDQGKGKIYPRDSVNDIPLSERGRREVRESAKEIKNHKIDLIYTSDFLRTRQTASIVQKELGLREALYDKRLRDMDLGVYHGKKKKAFYSDFPIEESVFFKAPSQGESYADVMHRVKNFLFEMEEENEKKRILVVSHGDTLLLLECYLKGLEKKDFMSKKEEGSGMRPAEFRRIN